MTRIPGSLRVGGLVAVLALTLTLAGSAGAANHRVWADPVGDSQRVSDSAYASDITQVELTSQDNGDTTIAVTLSDGIGHMSSGDELDVYLNTDRKAGTGENGFENVLVATGGSSGTSFQLCEFVTPFTCHAGLEGFGTDQDAGGGVHVVTFNITTGGISAFDFFAVSSFPRPGDPNNPLFDRAPDSNVLTFAVNADPDHDGVFGSSDKCPKTRVSRVNDGNHNGCPGLFNFIKAFRRQVAVAFSGYLQVRSLSFEGPIPAGTKVQLSSSSRGETLFARSGPVKSRRFRGNVSYGTVLTVRMTKPGWVGLYARFVATRGRGLALRKQACIPATGPQKPTPCSTSLRGK